VAEYDGTYGIGGVTNVWMASLLIKYSADGKLHDNQYNPILYTN
jgi:hypothetical protein